MKLTRKQLESFLQDTSLDARGLNLNARCPWCDGMEFGVSLVKPNNPFNCYRKANCGKTGPIQVLLEYLGIQRQFIEYVNLEEPLVSLEENETIIDLELPEVHPPLLWKRVYEDSYLVERGFTTDQFKMFEVGRSKFNPDYVTFLVRQNGKLTGYISRSTKTKAYIDSYNERIKGTSNKKILRYDNSVSDFSKMIFGLDEIIEGITTDVILVEGIFSKTKTDVNLGLYNCDWMKCGATFGAKFSIEQMELLKRKKVKNLWFWFEADVLDKVKGILAKASHHFNVRASYLSGKDPGDINSNEAFDLLHNSVNWLDYNLNFLSNKI